MMNVAHTTRFMAGVLTVGLLLTGCATTPGAGVPNEMVAATEAAGSGLSPSPSPSPTPSATTPTPTTPTPAPASADPTGPQVIRVTPGAERRLTRSDAFSAEYFEERSFQPVGRGNEVQALGATANCNSSWARELEFRFAENQGDLTFEVAQEMSSPSSEENLEWALVVDGRQVETKKIAFKETAEFTTSLVGVAVVKLQLRNPSPCSGQAIGLVTKAVIKG